MERRAMVLCIAAVVGLVACSGGTDDESPSLDRIDAPAVVDPSFDPFATDPSAPPPTDGG